MNHLANLCAALLCVGSAGAQAVARVAEVPSLAEVRKAMEVDRKLLRGPLAGIIPKGKTKAFCGACVNPEQPDDYRLPWCGRFSIPFGMLLLKSTAQELGIPIIEGFPVAFGNSVDTPELPVKALGLGATAPANLYHFVSYPGVAFAAVKNE